MTEPSAAHAAAVTDRSRLAGSAHSGDRDLAARQSLYQWQTPFPGEEFGRVETTELPGIITVDDPGPAVAHMASNRAWADQHDVSFEATIGRARTILVDHIAQHGPSRSRASAASSSAADCAP
ncbi:hypothetical protein ACGFZS_42465 [Streptomyces sp. NPDC048288]|uniref:hypothetical protein n=1 Tax=Streptomyces sp. NPDC048288 TaxID=3365529 RepID=UPI00371F1FE3